MITLQTLFFNELADIHEAEKQLVTALPKFIKAATCDDLIGAFQSHLEETQGHVKKLEQVFECFDRKARSSVCVTTRALLEEADKVMKDYDGSPVINAALIGIAQKIEHHEIAAYGCLHEWADVLKNKEAAGLLLEILEEEKATNDALTQLARDSSNQEALDEADDDDDEEEEDDDK